MPTYEFRCNACKKAFSLVMKVADLEKSKVTCPRCGEKDVRQVLSGFFAKTSRKS
jgi:putative FmdB family regulatory protein